ncbi:hypothetical protein K438DRAFT_2000521 [Mycena galopus ATCC 62051]|nr:hypothetical protein K438DRAFT_2000521 [Mycena galopus ATCC 62051]
MSPKKLAACGTIAFVRLLQFAVAPQIFTPGRMYDGRKNIKLRFDTGSQEFDLTIDKSPSRCTYKIKLIFAAINPGLKERAPDYFQQNQNKPLQFPDVICTEVGSGALIPLELYDVPPGELMRKPVPPEKTRRRKTYRTLRQSDNSFGLYFST